MDEPIAHPAYKRCCNILHFISFHFSSFHFILFYFISVSLRIAREDGAEGSIGDLYEEVGGAGVVSLDSGVLM